MITRCARPVTRRPALGDLLQDRADRPIDRL
jgi:hypothetical protein